MKTFDDDPRAVYKRRLENLWRDPEGGGRSLPQMDRAAYKRYLGDLWQQKPGTPDTIFDDAAMDFTDSEGVTLGAAIKRLRQRRKLAKPPEDEEEENLRAKYIAGLNDLWHHTGGPA